MLPKQLNLIITERERNLLLVEHELINLCKQIQQSTKTDPASGVNEMLCMPS